MSFNMEKLFEDWSDEEELTRGVNTNEASRREGLPFREILSTRQGVKRRGKEEERENKKKKKSNNVNISSELRDIPSQPGPSGLQRQRDNQSQPGQSGVEQQRDNHSQPGQRGVEQPGDQQPQPGPSGIQLPRDPQPQPSQDEDELMEPNVRESGRRTFAKSKATEIKYNVNLGDSWKGKKIRDIHRRMGRMFQNVLSNIQTNPNDKVKFTLKHPDLENPIVIPPMPANLMDANIIMSNIEKTLTSHQDLSIVDDMEMTVGVIEMPEGSARRQYVTNIHRDLSTKRSIVTVNNTDNMCAARSVAVAYTKLCLVDDQEFDEAVKDLSPNMLMTYKVLKVGKAKKRFYKHITENSRNEQSHMAKELCNLAGLPLNEPISIEDLKKFEEVLNVNICVIQAELGNKFVKSSNKSRPNIYLYLHDNHYDAIVNITGFFNKAYFCDHCLQPYGDKAKHVCDTCCSVCTSTTCKEDQPIECPDCHQICRNTQCLIRHKNTTYKKTSNRCKAFYRCGRCHKTMNSSRKSVHDCNEWFCSACEMFVVGNHLCYVRAIEPRKTEPKFIFYDVETTQETKIECSEGYLSSSPEGCEKCTPTQLCTSCHRCQNCKDASCGLFKHEANLIVAQTVCSNCIDNEEETCEECGQRCPTCKEVCPNCPLNKEVMFFGPGSSNQFFRWLICPQYEDCTCIAHNSKAFDGYFLLDYLTSQGIRPNNIIFNGTKLMYLKIEKGLNIRFLDSLNFLPMKLAALPKAFGILLLKKGYFCHFFNKEVNWNYIGPYPEPQMYGADQMSTKDREEFMKWYETQQGKTFNFKEELVAYCKSDVHILKEACLKYRTLMLESVGVDPFQCITVASAAMKVFKTKFLEEKYKVKLQDDQWYDAVYKDNQMKVLVNGEEIQGVSIKEKKFVSSSIAQVPSNGYVSHVSYSKSSIQWLEWMAHSENIQIQHALNGTGEFKIGPYSVDGVCHHTKTIYEYNGCFWHACPTCYPKDRTKIKNPRTGHCLSEMYAQTQSKTKYLERCGYKVITKWEHEFQEELKINPHLKDFVSSLDLQERLDPRDSFFGGRTNAIKLHHLIEEEEEIRYVDFTSLYPYVNKYKTYPVGHPEIITRDFKDLNNYFGIAKIKILAPRGLYLPVLPYRSGGKLKFPLCRRCADNETQDCCMCSEDQRALIGTWCIPEIERAIEKGYRILKIYEVYHFPETSKYDTETKSGGLFAEYIDTFLKFKQESSDWPAWCDSQGKKEEYIQAYHDNEGVQLDPANICKNPGLRSLAKLKLNSFWGKFGQRQNFVQSSYFTDDNLPEFYQLLSDSTKELKDFHIINDKLILVEYKHAYLQTPEDQLTNIFLATFTTCWARLHLYDVMDQLGDRVLYHDTDSVIYVHSPNRTNPQLGDYLGQLTNELDQNDYIIEYCSAGPKNYAYKTNKGNNCCKVRGFRLNFSNSQLIHFDTMKDIITNNRNKTIQTHSSKILRDKLTNTLYNKQETKTYQMVYDKRVLDPFSNQTFPYGY